MSLQNSIPVMEDALFAMSEDSFQKAGAILSDIQNNIREKIHKGSSSQIKNMIDRLKINDPMTDEDLAFIKLWILCDTQRYIKMENNYQDWLNEFERSKTELQKYENKECSTTDLFKIHGLLQDVIRVSHDIADYLQCKERIAKFEKATCNVSRINTQILVELLTEKLQSLDHLFCE